MQDDSTLIPFRANVLKNGCKMTDGMVSLDR